MEVVNRHDCMVLFSILKRSKYTLKVSYYSRFTSQGKGREGGGATQPLNEHVNLHFEFFLKHDIQQTPNFVRKVVVASIRIC